MLMASTALADTGAPMEAYYANIEKYTAHNAFITVAPRPTSTESGLPLSGMVICVKDNIHVAGMPSTAGTPLMARFTPARDAELVARLRAAGAFIIGKNNLHELAYGITSANRAFGVVRNAINADYIAGGSSGGTAVAVALGMADAGIGTDTGGSVRIPAALNGLVGFRPTTGRYPNNGMTLISGTRDTAGPITRSVADAYLLDTILSGSSPGPGLEPHKLQGLRLGVPREVFYRDLDEDVAKIMEQVLIRLKTAGVELVLADIPDLAELNEKVGFPIVLFETSQLLPAYLRRNIPGATSEDLLQHIASPDVLAVVGSALAGTISESAYHQALDVERPRLQAAYADYFRQQNVAAVIFPTTPLPARPISDDLSTVTLAGHEVPTFPTYIRNTDPASNAGIPGISLPAGRSREGLPVGIELDGPKGTDRELLAIALAIETLLMEPPPGEP
jgi:mandelamide amidase